jgi:hypothetical protein
VRRATVWIPWLVLTLSTVPASAFAQTPDRDQVDFRHATTLAVFGGGAVDASEAGPIAGGTIGWQVSRAIAFEGFGRWYDRAAGSDAFAAAMIVQADVLAARSARLFVSGGFGMYHVSFGPGAMDSMPAFYGHRMPRAADHVISTASFTDPAFVLGGGVKFPVSRHVSLRPGVDLTIVPNHSTYHYVTTFAVSLAYRFEEHPVTAARRK